jgi:hypothetical protein
VVDNNTVVVEFNKSLILLQLICAIMVLTRLNNILTPNKSDVAVGIVIVIVVVFGVAI